jgi:dipeptidase
MPQSSTPTPATARRSQLAHVLTARRSASTAAGIAAERVALADRERGTTRARVAAHQLSDNPVETVQSDL